MWKRQIHKNTDKLPNAQVKANTWLCLVIKTVESKSNRFNFLQALQVNFISAPKHAANIAIVLLYRKQLCCEYCYCCTRNSPTADFLPELWSQRYGSLLPWQIKEFTAYIWKVHLHLGCRLASRSTISPIVGFYGHSRLS